MMLSRDKLPEKKAAVESALSKTKTWSPSPYFMFLHEKLGINVRQTAEISIQWKMRWREKWMNVSLSARLFLADFKRKSFHWFNKLFAACYGKPKRIFPQLHKNENKLWWKTFVVSLNFVFLFILMGNQKFSGSLFLFSSCPRARN